MIAQLDDIMKFKLEDLTADIEHPDTIKSKMYWSKKVLEERERVQIRSYLDLWTGNIVCWCL